MGSSGPFLAFEGRFGGLKDRLVLQVAPSTRTSRRSLRPPKRPSKAKNGQNITFLVNSWTQIIQWSSVGHITIHFRGLNGLRRAPKPKFDFLTQKFKMAVFARFRFLKSKNPISGHN